MLKTTDVYLQRLFALLEYGFPHAERMQAEGRLDFGSFKTCLACAWCETEYAQADGWAKIENGYPNYPGSFSSQYSLKSYFGLDLDDVDGIFGATDSLADRRAYLEALIAKRMEARHGKD